MKVSSSSDGVGDSCRAFVTELWRLQKKTLNQQLGSHMISLVIVGWNGWYSALTRNFESIIVMHLLRIEQVRRAIWSGQLKFEAAGEVPYTYRT